MSSNYSTLDESAFHAMMATRDSPSPSRPAEEEGNNHNGDAAAKWVHSEPTHIFRHKKELAKKAKGSNGGGGGDSRGGQLKGGYWSAAIRLGDNEAGGTYWIEIFLAPVDPALRERLPFLPLLLYKVRKKTTRHSGGRRAKKRRIAERGDEEEEEEDDSLVGDDTDADEVEDDVPVSGQHYRVWLEVENNEKVFYQADSKDERRELKGVIETEPGTGKKVSETL